MQDSPDALDIIAVVMDFLRQTEPGTTFERKVAAAALAIAHRELALSPEDAKAERARLADLLGRDGDLDELTKDLAEEIGAGKLDLATPGLADHLWQTTLAKVAVDQPSFPLYRRLTD
ncbi:MAG: DUF6285 domain-containing protein [Alphaproteobacteria bacterium]|jgi:hypothetical protein|nr:DUF6285 domain-containing protein [Alphaproteobacteria bacterium]